MNGSEQNSPEKERFDVQFNEKKGGVTIIKRLAREVKRKGEDSSWYYLGFIGEIGFTIALPIVGGALIGGYIDRTWSTYPKATLSLLLFGIVISMVSFIHTIAEIVRKKK